MRYPSIDVLRTIAIFVMVFVHFAENLAGVTLPLAGFGAPLFAFLSGVSYKLLTDGKLARGASEESVSKMSVRRGLFVFGVGIAFNVLVWLPEDTFNWDVLTFIGTALLVLNGVRRLPLAIPVLMAVIAVLVSPILRGLADYSSYWQNLHFDYDFTLSDVVIGFLATGYFPIFPWIAFSLTGFVVASAFLSEPDDQDEPRPSIWQMVAIGAAIATASGVGLAVQASLPDTLSKRFLGGWTMFPPTVEYVLGTLGMTLVLLGLAHRFLDPHADSQRLRPALSIAKTFSQYSFTIYVLHHLVHVWPLWIYAVARGEDTTLYWMNAMPLWSAVVLAVVFLALCFATLRWLGPDRNIGIESWMRWLCD